MKSYISDSYTHQGSGLLSRDRQSIWHPFTQHGLNHSLLPVVSASGAYLYLENGRRLLDGISSWWVNLHGHSHPRIARAISKQASTLEHVIFAGFTHLPAIQLSETLLEFMNERGAPYQKVFFSDNGSTSVEVALKMAYQYFQNRKEHSRNRFIALKGSYHGDTFGAMAVSEPEGFHHPFRRILLDSVEFVEPNQIQKLDELLRKDSKHYAAFIFEPLIQGAEGMRVYSAEYLREAIELCKKYGVLTIGDEVFSGFYRTGRAFAFDHLGIAPDLLCLSKGLTGGFLPLALTLTTEEIYQAFYSLNKSDAFLHGHSYTANPIACASALESWKILQEEDCQKRINILERKTRSHIDRIHSEFPWARARALGTIGAVTLKSPIEVFQHASQYAYLEGVLLRPLGSVIYTVPPYCTTEGEIDHIYEIIYQLVRQSLSH